jgi:hypothetical protein
MDWLFGFVPYAPAPTNCPGVFPHSMENFYVPMATLMAGWNNYTWDAFEVKLDDIVNRGNQARVCPCFECPGFR